jgi:hypothetical protein
MDMVHLEDLAYDQYGNLEPGWDSVNHYSHWMRYSDDPLTRINGIFAIEEEQIAQPTSATGEEDKSNWSTLVPTQYHQYGKVFSKVASTRMPIRKPYDHAIELLPGASLPKPAKGYPLNHAEQAAIKLFIKEHLERATSDPQNHQLLHRASL